MEEDDAIIVENENEESKGGSNEDMLNQLISGQKPTKKDLGDKKAMIKA